MTYLVELLTLRLNRPVTNCSQVEEGKKNNKFCFKQVNRQQQSNDRLQPSSYHNQGGQNNGYNKDNKNIPKGSNSPNLTKLT